MCVLLAVILWDLLPALELIVSPKEDLVIREIDNYDCFGKDLVEKGKILEYEIKSYEACKDKCVAHRHCTHFGWSKRNVCWLKHAEDEPEVEKSLRKVAQTMCGIIKDRLKKPKRRFIIQTSTERFYIGTERIGIP
uniref:Apple domain-containing protein n=1 Tax=Romanomermis culicivorax TaxID=13658 RepID=A0A915JXF8_ROMCU